MWRHLGLLLVVALAAATCAAQSKPDPNPAPCSVAPQPDPCGTTPAPASKAGAAQKFPFPGEPDASKSASPDASPSLNGVPQAPEAPAASKDFPFPGDVSKPDSTGNSGAGSSSSSSSSSGDTPAIGPDGNPATPALQDKGTEGSAAAPGRHILHRVNPVGTKLQSPDERESEDLSVAHFYVQTGDLKGAYLRSQDAVKIAPDDPDAHYMLAEMALKLNKRDEAIAEYKACLKLDPVEKEAKDARKALERLQP
jgi:hypothetical protein